MGMKVVTETTDRQKKDRYHLTPFDINSLSLPSGSSFFNTPGKWKTGSAPEKQMHLLNWKKVGLWTRDRTWWMRKRSAFRNYILYHTFFLAGQALFIYNPFLFRSLRLQFLQLSPRWKINWFARSGMEPDNMKWALDPGLAFQRNQSYRID